ncbi:MAG: GIY-YIG nuclease family protein [Candidatus Omnitrophica bacterium]|nr:GIY-YIG nuclease family protein [Candidatus Omnitrophota bacterium]
MHPPSSWFLYIVKCKDRSLYTGITTDITRRVREHNLKKGAFYTKNKTPVKLVYQEPMADQSQARKRESFIKKLTREQKLELVKKPKAKVKRAAKKGLWAGKGRSKGKPKV